MNNKLNTIIEQFKLEPHPEGGFFKETYRSNGKIPSNALDPDIEGERNYCTGIYFLISSSDFSAFHKINQDEMWHFYEGSPVKIHMLSPNGDYSFAMVGNQYDKGQVPQFTVPAKYWFAAEVMESDSFSSVGCTVSPGFDFKDFVLPSRKILIDLFPQYEALISKFTKS